jgi:hypothetical protein
MIKSSSTMLLVLLCSLNSRAQGTITLSNHIVGAVEAPVTFNCTGQGVGTIPGMVAQLFLVNGTVLAPVATTISFRGTTDPLAKYFDGGMASIPGTVPGQTVTLRLRFWSGPSFEGSIYRGESASFTQKLGGDLFPPENLVNLPSSQILLLGCPEPSTIALGLLGGMLTLIGRAHRKR